MTSPNVNPLEAMGQAGKQASAALAGCSTRQKNDLLLTLADTLEKNSAQIISANAKDMEAARKNNMNESMQDRLLLNEARLAGIACDVRQVAGLHDPVGEILEGRRLDSGISLMRRRVPLGVVAAIYEARPNVTADVASLCLKTGNAVILRGGKETVNTNAATVQSIQAALKKRKLPETAVQAITDPDRSLVTALLQLDKYVDMLIPRGGAGLHRFCRENSRIPVITGGIGVCHIFVDKSARQDASMVVLANAKVQRPSVCNSVETALVHREIAAEFLPGLADHLGKLGVTLHYSDSAGPFLQDKRNAVPVHPEDFDKEWLTLDLNAHVVNSLDEAVSFIRQHGSGHSDAILTECMENAERFVQEVDSSSVYVNASTRFTDGSQFGLGAEVAISTQKLHARGPMGLDALTTYKWIGIGNYTVRS